MAPPTATAQARKSTQDILASLPAGNFVPPAGDASAALLEPGQPVPGGALVDPLESQDATDIAPVESAADTAPDPAVDATSPDESADADLAALQPDAADSPEIAADKSKWRAAYDRLQNKANARARAAEQRAGTADPEAVQRAQAFDMLMRAPDPAKALQALQQHFGMAAPTPTPAAQRAKLIEGMDQEARPVFEALMEEYFETKIAPQARPFFEEAARTRNARITAEQKAVTDKYPTAGAYLPAAEELIQNMARLGKTMSLDTALISVSEGKVLHDRKVAQQKTNVATATLGKPAAGDVPTRADRKPDQRKTNDEVRASLANKFGQQSLLLR